MDINQRLNIAHDLIDSLSDTYWPSSYQEPDYVAKLVTMLPSAIKESLKKNCPGFVISAGGAFIHQKPLVNFVDSNGIKQSCEVGDLLIVCREKRSFGLTCNALLLQAKIADDIYNNRLKEDAQFILYTEWPEFTYSRAGHLNGIKRSVLPKTITQGAQYMLIDKHNPLKISVASVNNPLSGANCFPCAIASVLSFNRGRTIQMSNPRDNWSQMIVDLLKLSASSEFNRRKHNFKDVKRWQGDSYFSYLLDNTYEDIYIEDNDRYDVEGIHLGVGVICVDMIEEGIRNIKNYNKLE